MIVSMISTRLAFANSLIEVAMEQFRRIITDSSLVRTAGSALDRSCEHFASYESLVGFGGCL